MLNISFIKGYIINSGIGGGGGGLFSYQLYSYLVINSYPNQNASEIEKLRTIKKC